MNGDRNRRTAIEIALNRLLIAATAALVLVTLTPDAAAETLDSLLSSGELAKAYNPELLDYLLEEGSDELPETVRRKALDQLVTALKADIEITPEEQRTAALAAAGAGIAQLFGNRDASDLGDVAQGATHQVWSGWVDSALTLQRAGYTEEANAFFEKCIEVFPYSDLKGRCAIGLAAGKPAEAYDRLLALTESADPEAIKSALRLLGRMAGSEGFPEKQRAAVVARLEEFTGGIKKATYGVAACQGLVATGDPRAVPVLQKLSTGMLNTDFYPCARRGLLITFGKRDVVPLLEKELRGGTFSTTKPSDRLAAASLLIEAGEASGYSWAEQQLRPKKESKLKRFMKTDDDKVDFRPALVSVLVRTGGERSLDVLRTGFSAAESGSWLQTWIAIGMLELGDTSKIDLVRRALSNPDWQFTTVRIATALAKHDDLSGIPALERLYGEAVRGVEPTPGRAMLAYLGGEGAAYEAGKANAEWRLIRLRTQIAHALATIDRPESEAVLVTILDDPEPSVRASAAYALARMSDPSAAAGLVKALSVDYGSIGGASRDPVVQAHVLRRLTGRFGDSPSAKEGLGVARKSPYLSVRFLALSRSGG